MRLLALALALTSLPIAAGEPTCPLWDGKESIEQYAKKAGIPPTKTINLGDGVTMELVLIPAGTFMIGSPEPPPMDEEGYRNRVQTGQVILTMGGGLLLILMALVLTRAVRRRQRPQYSLAWFLAMTVAAGVGLLGGLHWYFSARAFAQAQREYQAVLASLRNSFHSERPAHEVTLTTPYYVGKCEVTQEQYQQVMGTNPSHFRGRDLPVEDVAWYEAQEFCKKASTTTRFTIRLPTEAEWEHACRAGTRTAYHSGALEADLDRVGWYDKNSNRKTHPVGEKVPNAWGVHDMHGNVSEWCADWYETYTAEAAVDPQGPAQGVHRVLRGGASYGSSPATCRSASRYGCLCFARDDDLGFRVVVPVPGSRGARRARDDQAGELPASIQVVRAE